MLIVLIVLGVLVILSGAYILMLRPRPEPKTSVEPLKVDYAHRGLWGKDETVENTIPAFRAAERAGFGIELDVRLSSDDCVVVFHDDTLERLCGRPDSIESMTASELSWMDIKGTYEKMPLFEDVLSMIDHRIPLLIELKGNDDRLCELVAQMLDGYDGYFSVCSFNPLLLGWFKKNRPRFVRGQITTNMFKSAPDEAFLDKLAITTMMFNFIARPDYISTDIRYPKSIGALLCSKIYHPLTFAWTVSDEKSLSEARSEGNIVIFEKFTPSNPRIVSRTK